MTTAGAGRALEEGRLSFSRQAWEEAFTLLSTAEREKPLAAEDLERLASCAQLTGREASGQELWARAHQEFVHEGDFRRAVRCAFRLTVPLLLGGEQAQGSGWLGRARRLLDDERCVGGKECAERGYLSAAEGLQAIVAGDVETAERRFAEAASIGDRFREPDLMALSRQGQGRSLIHLGEIARGTALLDEAMAAVTAGEVSALVVGDIYCSVIAACHDMFDLRRAREWTEALAQWCARQPEMAPYRGQCLLHRAEIMALHGAWPNARAEAERARERFSVPPPSRAAGMACYQLADIHRLRGELDDAEVQYREASRLGVDPQPGLAQVRFAQGKVDAAWAAISRSVEEAKSRRVRGRQLPAYIEIAVAAGERAAARVAADELAQLAARFGTPYLTARAREADAAVLLAEEEPRKALSAAREATTLWRDLGAPHETARARVLVARACHALGDEETAALELDSARRTFEELGARSDVARVDALMHRPATKAAGGLTPREVEVLRLVATGRTNRAVAGALGISEKTVARHVSNIFTKCGLSSRAAATAYAYEHALLQPPP